MRGFPKALNTKDDYLYIKENFDKELWQPEYQNLLDTLSDWFFVRVLDTDEEAPEGDNYKVIENEQGEGEEKTTARSLYEYKENEHAKLFELGFTVDEVKKVLAE